ncbi:hypothetical protein RHMOL_Rhmol13G0139500 [Rhododendron molle]|uniref:Uncharacterized protein n=1 Tax=Rhododendron molle TaxID=49168 RepID=A0ACC0L708_RHOML|nr:hypothetical protein RHMOL_Rhmol13G0139500 [Rhododendron molle]
MAGATAMVLAYLWASSSSSWWLWQLAAVEIIIHLHHQSIILHHRCHQSISIINHHHHLLRKAPANAERNYAGARILVLLVALGLVWLILTAAKLIVFYLLSGGVDGVLGQTYRSNYVSKIKMGVLMPVVGGAKEYASSALFSTDCAMANFSSQLNSSESFEHESLECASTGMDGTGVVCKR